MTAEHAFWSASGMEQRMLCPGSAVLQREAPDNANEYAAEGTAAHQVLTWAGQQGKNAADFLGTCIELNAKGRVMPPGSLESPTWTFTVDDDMAEHVQVCLDYVREVAGEHPVLWDVKVNYASYLNEPEDNAWGTADVIILLPGEVVVVDFKYGMGVEVGAGYDLEVPDRIDELTSMYVNKPNPQMACYGLGALNDYRDFGDFKHARLVISQPRTSRKPSEYDLIVADLETWGFDVARKAVELCKEAQRTSDRVGRDGHWEQAYLRPGEKQCQFCRAKATCPALRKEVALAVFDTSPATPDEFADAIVVDAELARDIAFTDEDVELLGDDPVPRWLSVSLGKVDLIEDWCKAIRAEVERRLLAGEAVPDYKLVAGKRGNRQFANKDDAETLLKSFRLKTEEMYDFTLISPTTAEKRAKTGVIGPRQWVKLQEMIVQREGKPHVAHVSDARPALTVTPVADEFTDVAATDPDAFAWVR